MFKKIYVKIYRKKSIKIYRKNLTITSYCAIVISNPFMESIEIAMQWQTIQHGVVLVSTGSLKMEKLFVVGNHVKSSN